MVAIREKKDHYNTSSIVLWLYVTYHSKCANDNAAYKLVMSTHVHTHTPEGQKGEGHSAQMPERVCIKRPPNRWKVKQLQGEIAVVYLEGIVMDTSDTRSRTHLMVRSVHTLGLVLFWCKLPVIAEREARQLILQHGPRI